MENNYKEMNVCQKLQVVRDLLNNTKMPKTGFNNFSNYSYYQNSDFMPYVQKYCREIGLCPLVTFNKETEEAIMIVMNADKMEETLEFKCRYSIPQLKGSNTCQMIGGMTTFMQKYLYQIAFCITENDAFDGLSPEQNVEVNPEEDDKKEELIKFIIKNKENEKLKESIKELSTDALQTVINSMK